MSARPAPSPVFGAQARAQERARRAKAEQAKRPELKLVKKEQPKPRLAAMSPRSRLFLCFGLAVALLFALVAFHVLLTQGQFSLQKLQNKADQQQAQYERLRLQVAQLESPSRIQSEAVNRLGMVQADKVTPITPGASELPRNATGGAAPVRGGSTTTDDQSMDSDPGAWTSVKPHLNSTNQ